MAKGLLEITAEIITAQASHVRMSSDEISEAMEKVFRSLQKIKDAEAEAKEGVTVFAGKGEEVEELRKSPLASIQRTKVICLECGLEFKILSKQHLALHSLTAKEYKKKHKIPARKSLVAKALTAKRRKSAIERGLGRKLAEYRKKKSPK